ncbi:MAG: transglycosylase SLT domain-containing protein, partial [Calditrichia bacterium]
HSPRQLFDPQLNILMGTSYLSGLLNRFNGSLVMALAAYNAGPHRVERWKKIYDWKDSELFMENLAFEQTRVYVRTGLKYLLIYKTFLYPGQVPPEVGDYSIPLSQTFQNSAEKL